MISTENLKLAVIRYLDTCDMVRKRGEEDYVFEVFADYRDNMEDSDAIKTLTSSDPEQTFQEQLFDWYSYYIDETISNMVREILDDCFGGALEFEEEDMLRELVWQYVNYELPESHFLKLSFCSNIMIDTGDGNYDFVLNTHAPAWDGENGLIHKDASIVWLAETQGYTREQLSDALDAESEEDVPEGFLRSMYTELANTSSHMNVLTFLVNLTLEQLLSINQMLRDYELSDDDEGGGSIVIDKNTMAGLYDPWSGAGSVLEITLEKDVEIPVKYIRSVLPDGGDGRYSITDVYGMSQKAWQYAKKDIQIIR